MVYQRVFSSICQIVTLLTQLATASSTDVEIPVGGLVSVRRSVDLSGLPNSTCEFSGVVVFGGPSSLDHSNKYFFLANRQLLAYQLVIDDINRHRCGILINNKHYKIELQTYDDQSSVDISTIIGNKLALAPYSENSTSAENSIDMILAGYSSTLTRPLAESLAEHDPELPQSHVMMAAGSSLTSIFENRSSTFTTIPPAKAFMKSAIQGLSTKTNAKTIATVWEEVAVTTSICGAVPELANEFGLTLMSQTGVETSPNSTVFEPVASQLKKEDPDIVVTCTYDCAPWISALRKVDWSPKAQVFSICIGGSAFVESVGTDAEYIMGVSPWHESVLSTDAVTGWTSQEFSKNYQEVTSASEVVYQATSAAAVISIVVQAIEAVNSVQNVTALAEYISTTTFPTVFGDILFDDNGQNAASVMLLQHDQEGIVQTVYPTEKSSASMLYPMPTWAHRDCLLLSGCRNCTQNGQCQCSGINSRPRGVGAMAKCDGVIPYSGASSGVIIGAVFAALCAIPIMFWIVKREKQKQNDSLWMIKKGDIQFADPPLVIGHGRLGPVLLGEFRGTEVAVKRVIPPKENGDSKMKGKKITSTTSTRETREISFGNYFDNVAKKSTRNLFRKSVSVVNAGSSLGKKPSKLLWSALRHQLEKNFLKEMSHLSKLRHPCVATIMGAVISDVEDPVLVMENMDHGSLHDILHNKMMILEGEILFPMIKHIAQGMQFLHSSNPQVIVADLKAAHILVDSKFQAKVSNFGLACNGSSPYWMAPELLRRDCANTPESDVYAYGILLYEVFAREDPYEGENAVEVLKRVADPLINKRPPIPRNCPSQIEGLLTDCLVADPKERPTFEEINKRLKRMEIFKGEISDNQTRSTVSLFDIFPRKIAEALSAGRKVDSEHKELVTIFFSDIVGFTDISSSLDPRKVASMLDRLYTKFDDISVEEGVFKVETIGDAYMAVTNLVEDQDEDHVARIVRFADRAIAAANDTLIDIEKPEKGYVNIRVGFHSGPVVADVVGTRNPRYCLFGDTVNTASRMESSSQINCIHCSSSAAKLLAKQDRSINIKARGMIDIKGKGKMSTFWVNTISSSSKITDDEIETDMELLELNDLLNLIETSQQLSERSTVGQGQDDDVSVGFPHMSAIFKKKKDKLIFM